MNIQIYRRVDGMGTIPLSDLPRLIERAYRFSVVYFWNNYGSDKFDAMKYFFLLVALLSGGLIIWLIMRNKTLLHIKKLSLLSGLIVLFPLAINLIHVMVGTSTRVDYLVIYGIILAPIFCLSVLQLAGEEVRKEKSPRSWAIPVISWAVVIALLFCVYGYWLRSNQAYLKLHLAYEQGYAYSNTLLTRIQSVEGFTHEEKIVFVGSPKVEPSAPELRDLGGMRGIINSIPGDDSRNGMLTAMLRNYLGNTQAIVSPSKEELAEMGLQEVAGKMPFYPACGSIVRVRDWIVVRFSEQ